MGVGLYLHIPFCKRKCVYCDFCSYAGREAFWLPVVAGMKQEIRFAHGLDVDTVYFGGGTPTLLPAALLRELMREIYKNLHVAQGAEISMEANPGTVDREKLDALREMGVNRLSIGCAGGAGYAAGNAGAHSSLGRRGGGRARCAGGRV